MNINDIYVTSLAQSGFTLILIDKDNTLEFSSPLSGVVQSFLPPVSAWWQGSRSRPLLAGWFKVSEWFSYADIERDEFSSPFSGVVQSFGCVWESRLSFREFSSPFSGVVKSFKNTHQKEAASPRSRPLLAGWLKVLMP